MARIGARTWCTPRAPAAVAVVLVTYNSADVLPGALDSLVMTGVRLDAVIVADNASRDDSVKVAESAVNLPVRVVQIGTQRRLRGRDQCRDRGLDVDASTRCS